MPAPKLAEVIGKVRTLYTLPTVLIKVMDMINDPRTSAADLGKVISQDQTMTARLLRLVNSSFYGFPRKISSVNHAIAVIGFYALRDLILATTVFDLFPQRAGGNGFNRAQFWDHSIGCAVGAKVIAGRIGYELPEEAFVSGLLHDVGKVVEDQSMPDHFDQILELVREENILFVEAEKKVLTWTHASLGKSLGDRWRLPLKLVEPIALHHQPDLSQKFPQETAIVHLADILSRALDMGSGGDSKIPLLNERAWNILGLDLKDIEPIMDEMVEEFKKSASLFRAFES